MVMKIVLALLFAVVGLTVLGMVNRARRGAVEDREAKARRRKLKGEDFGQCPECGVYKPLSEPCACGADNRD